MSFEINEGDVIRVYGYPGTFIAGKLDVRYGQKIVSLFRDEVQLWDQVVSSVVEINGRPVPIRSCPMAYPAPDYPHEPQFDYSDGPQARGAEALQWWKENAVVNRQNAIDGKSGDENN